MIMNKITALPVERDNYGYWTHPLYEQFCDGREVISPDEFNAWLEANGLEWKVSYLDDEEIDPDVDGCDISTWQPDPPAGNGWFVGSIHDTEPCLTEERADRIRAAHWAGFTGRRAGDVKVLPGGGQQSFKF